MITFIEVVIRLSSRIWQRRSWVRLFIQNLACWLYSHFLFFELESFQLEWTISIYWVNTQSIKKTCEDTSPHLLMGCTFQFMESDIHWEYYFTNALLVSYVCLMYYYLLLKSQLALILSYNLLNRIASYEVEDLRSMSFQHSTFYSHTTLLLEYIN